MLAILMNSMRVRRQKKTKIEKQKAVMVCCRTCLTTEDLHPIFYGKSSGSKRSEDLRLVTGLEIMHNDGLPQNICSKCVESMNEALKFRRTSEKANETLHSMGFRKSAHAKSIRRNAKITPPKRIPKPTEDMDNTGVNSEDISFDNYEDDFQSNEFDAEVKGSSYSKALKAAATDVAPFKCNVCNKEFRMKNTFRAHMRFHTNYCVCELCGKKCRNNNLLLLHKRGRHGMERIHKCNYCDYSAANKEGLIIHERRHTGEKPYVCDHCGASFHRRSNLVQHIAIHLPDKNFQCEQCHKRFHSKKFLQSHKFKMHQGRRYTYVCHVCRAHFTSTDSARKHLTRAHGVPRAQQPPIYRIPNPQLNARLGKLN